MMEGASTYAIVPLISGLCNVLIDRLLSENTRRLLMGHDSTATELSRLRTSLMAVANVFNSAEEMQFERPDVRSWLDEVRSAVYDAEDLLDEMLTDVHQGRILKSHDESSRTSKSSNMLKTITTAWRKVSAGLNPFHKGIDSSISDLNGRFEAFSQVINALLPKTFEHKHDSQKPSRSRLYSTDMVDESQIVGREQERDFILQLLEEGVPKIAKEGSLEKRKDLIIIPEENRIRIIAIVGMGGVGKTTLAQVIYNHPRVRENFQFRGWACMPDRIFDVFKTIQDIIISSNESLSSMSSEALTHDKGKLQKLLKSAVKGKKTLIVIDNVWDEYLSARFNDLLTPLQLGGVAPGSTIILTTRYEDIAATLHPIHIEHLEELPHADCLNLFTKRAFGDPPHAIIDENLEEIIEDVVAKCKGLPLAITSLGGLLRDSDPEGWSTIASNKMWDSRLPDGILPALLLSYYQLDPQLKKCFAYCSLFPKNYYFNKDKLVMLWIAEGFTLPHRQDKRRMEDIGEEYFNILSARSFFQVSGTKNNYFVMHDLIHDLAVHVMGEFGFMLQSKYSNDVDVIISPRHFSFKKSNYDTTRRMRLSYNYDNCLRTFLPVGASSVGQPYLSNELLQSLKFFGRLRVLSLCGYRITSIPPTVGNLKHLRYLDFSSTLIQKLPKTICKLSNLQTLLLFECRYLRKLPKMMRDLIHLRHLDIRGTPHLREMPEYIGSLSCLQTLTDFVIGKGHGKSIAELAKLELRGSLVINGLENVVDIADVVAANLKDKQHLVEIVLRESPTEVLEALQPNYNLRRLTIEDSKVINFPDWLGDKAFYNLTALNLDYCPECVKLPPLGQLPLLRDLSIKRFNSIETIGPEFYGEHREFPPFKSLVTLKFEQFLRWRNWLPYGGDIMPFPSLQELYIWHCSKVDEIPFDLPNLIILDVSSCTRLRGCLRPSQNLRQLRLVDFGDLDLSYLAQMIYLTQLSLSWSRQNGEKPSISQAQSALPLLTFLEHVSMKFMFEAEQRHWKFPPLIRTITVRNCGDQDIDIEDCTHIQSFEISGSNSIVKLPTGNRKMLNYVELTGKERSVLQVIHEGNRDGLESLYDLTICAYEVLHYPNLLLTARNLVTLHLWRCSGLSSLSIGMSVHYPCLQFLSIDGCEDLKSILEDGIPAQLQTLQIAYCNELRSLPESMSTCTTLQQLEVLGCTQLVSWPRSGLPPKLRELHCDRYYSNWGLNRLTSLVKLTLTGLRIDSHLPFESFPAGGSLPTSLTVLSVCGFVKLRFINCRELQRIPSLRELEIKYCPQLRSFSYGELPQSLCRLAIWGSPLAARCQNGNHYAEMASRITCLELFEGY